MPAGVIVWGIATNWESGLSTDFLTFILYIPNRPIKVWKIKRNTKKPFGPVRSIKIEHKNGPLIAPNPNANWSPAPAATNLSFEIKSFVWASIN